MRTYYPHFPKIGIYFSRFQHKQQRARFYLAVSTIFMFLAAYTCFQPEFLNPNLSTTSISMGDIQNDGNSLIDSSFSSSRYREGGVNNIKLEFPGFTENRGQHPDPTLFYYFMQDTYAICFYKSQIQVYTRLATDDPWEYLSITFPGALSCVPLGIERLSATTNYFTLQPAITGVGHYAEIHYDTLYPGITLRFYCVGNSLKYDFIVSPLVDPSIIQLELDAPFPFDAEITPERVVCTSRITSDLILWEDHSLLAYQDQNTIISTNFCQRETTPIRYGFTTENYNPFQVLVIDPILISFSTFLGGSIGAISEKITIDNSGNVYVAGYTWSGDFPNTCIWSSYIGSYSFFNIFVAKLSPDTRTLLYSAFLGGSVYEQCGGLVADEIGRLYITGYTSSLDFPIENAFDNVYNGGSSDGFLTILSSDGQSLLCSTYLGGSGEDKGNGITINNVGDVYVTGFTNSSDFPTLNAFDATFNGDGDVFITKFASDGQSLHYSTYFGGSRYDSTYGIVVDDMDVIYITGVTSSFDFPLLNAYDAICSWPPVIFVAKFASDGQSLLYSTYFGDVGNTSPIGIAIDNMGCIYLAGDTLSPNFPTVNAYNATYNGGLDAFVTKFSSDGQSLIYSTYFGGSGDEWTKGIAIDNLGGVYITGFTNSSDLPTRNAYDLTHNGGYGDAFIFKLSPDGHSSGFCTYLGGEGVEEGSGISVDLVGNVYILGYTDSSDFPLIRNLYPTFSEWIEIFVVKLENDTDNDLLPDGWEYLMGLNTTDPSDAALDKDNDGLTNLLEFQLGTNASNPDTDSDLLPDSWEYSIGLNPTDPSDAAFDMDNDDLSNLLEFQLGTNMSNPDTDYDLLPDGWEYLMGFNATDPLDAILDFDEDSLTNLLEYLIGTNPFSTDTDEDQLPDDWEYDMGFNATEPLDATLDFDEDGLTNLLEYFLGTNPFSTDTDEDQLPDHWEYDMGLNVSDSSDATLDFDGDGLSNLAEYLRGTDPNDRDSDDDGFQDGIDRIPLSFWIPTGLLLNIAFVLGILLLGFVLVLHQHRKLINQLPTSMLIQMEQRLRNHNYIAAKDVLQRYLHGYQIKLFRAPPPPILFKLLQTVTVFSRYYSAINSIPKISEIAFDVHEAMIIDYFRQIETFTDASTIEPQIHLLRDNFDHIKELRKNLLFLYLDFQKYQQRYTDFLHSSPIQDSIEFRSQISHLFTDFSIFSQKVHDELDSYLPQCSLIRDMTVLQSDIKSTIENSSHELSKENP